MKKLILFTGLVVLFAFVAVTWQYYHTIQHWGAIHTGSANTPGTPSNYNYWSGFGSVFPWEFGLFVSVGVWFATHYRLHNCHIDGCPWIGRYPVAGGHFKVCRRHHPESHVRSNRVTFEHVQTAHAMHLLRGGTVVRHAEHKDAT